MRTYWAKKKVPAVSFFRIRRIRAVILGIILAVSAFFATIPFAYGIMALNGVRELTISRILPIILGVICGTTVNPIGSDQEMLRTNRARIYRMVVPFAVLAFSQAVISAAGLMFAKIYPEHDVGSFVPPMMLATAFFCGVAICSAVFLNGSWQLVPPALIALPMIGFGYRTFYEPQGWNILLTTSPVIAGVTVLVLASAFAALSNRY